MNLALKKMIVCRVYKVMEFDEKMGDWNVCQRRKSWDVFLNYFFSREKSYVD